MIDFQIMEAVSLKVQVEDAKAKEKAEKDAARQDFKDTRNKENFAELDKYR